MVLGVQRGFVPDPQVRTSAPVPHSSGSSPPSVLDARRVQSPQIGEIIEVAGEGWEDNEGVPRPHHQFSINPVILLLKNRDFSMV